MYQMLIKQESLYRMEHLIYEKDHKFCMQIFARTTQRNYPQNQYDHVKTMQGPCTWSLVPSGTLNPSTTWYNGQGNKQISSYFY